MTLATVSRYDPARTRRVGDHAVVVGASIAGLCAARVLADCFETVTVLERDPLSNRPVPRRGVPQGGHLHVLQEAGRATLEDLCPGFTDDLVAAGGVEIGAARDARFYMRGDFLADGHERQVAYSATRPLYELVIRRHVCSREPVDIRAGCQFAGYLADEAARTVRGVRIRDEDGDGAELAADLVVDATGRTSHTAGWLDDHGYTAPPVDEVHVDVGYSTTLLDRPADDRLTMVVTGDPERPRGGAVVPVEDGRWLLTLSGMHGDYPPTEPDAFEAYAETLPVPHLRRLLAERARTDDAIQHYRFPSNRRQRYEALDRFPDGLVVLGDAIASFNPVYGQGMSVAALEAVHLHHALAAGGLGDLGRRVFDRAAETIDLAWNMAVVADHRFPETRGPKPRGADLQNWYLTRLLRRAHTDGHLSDAFLHVQMMERPPSSLVRPGILWQVLRPWG